MSRSRRFSRPTVTAFDDCKYLAIRAGVGDHRFRAVWVVVVRNRVFVRPWNDKPTGWYRVFLDEPCGAVQIGQRELLVRARTARGERLMDEIDAGYKVKYPTPGSRQYVRGFATPRRRATTLELCPR
jgi:hypothetical protein